MTRHETSLRPQQWRFLSVRRLSRFPEGAPDGPGWGLEAGPTLEEVREAAHGAGTGAQRPPPGHGLAGKGQPPPRKLQKSFKVNWTWLSGHDGMLSGTAGISFS